MPSLVNLTRLATLAFIAALVVLVVLATLALREVRRLEDLTRRTLHTRDVLAQNDLVLQLITDAETSARRYAVTGSPQFLGPYQTAVRALPAASSELRQLAGDDPERERRLGALLPLIDSKLAQLDRVIDTRRSAGGEAAQQVISSADGHGVMERIRKLFFELDGAEESHMKERLYTGVERARSSSLALTLLTGTAPVFLALAWIFNRRAVAYLSRTQTMARLGEARLLVTLQSCGDGLIVTDEAGKVTMINPVAQALTGWREDQACGIPLDEVFRIVNEFTRDTVESPVSRVLREGKVVGLANHSVLIARDGTERPIDDSGAPIKGEDGHTAGVVLVFRDVTARKLSEQARERLLRAEAEREAAVRASETKDQFLALVSHELRAPLAAIRGWLHLLAGGFLPEAEVPGAVQRISRNAKLQERLINDLLDVSRITAGKLEVIRSPVDLIEIARSALDECRSMAEEKGVALALETPEYRMHVLGDEHRLVQSIGNLLRNGIKFTPAGGSVVIRFVRHGEKAVVTVTDTGVGMTQEVLGRLFERFWQADSSKTREQGGLGLGLTIAKYLIEEHEGTLRADSPGTGCGAVFTIELSLLDAGPVEGAPDPKGTAITRDLTGIHVLLVDDDQDSRDAIQVLLEARGAKVKAASSVQEAILAYEADPPAVVVSDIGMPKQDGYSLAGELRKRDARLGRRTAMIAVTGFAGASERHEALERGFDAHLAKPIDLEDLAARIRTLARN